MRLLPKVAFKWKEPKDFVRAKAASERARRRWWHRPLATAVLTVLLTVLLLPGWYLARFDPTKHPRPFSQGLPVAWVLSMFFTYLVPWIYSFDTPEIALLDTKRIHVHRSGNLQIKYSDIVSFGWELHGSFAVLKLKHRRGGEFRLGVPLDVPREAVTTFLAERCPTAEYRGYHAGPGEAE
jgi:hypothetical protein